MPEVHDPHDDLASLLSADGDGPASRIDPSVARSLVEQALDRHAADADAQHPRPLRVPRLGWLLAAAFVLAGSAAAMVRMFGEPPQRDLAQTTSRAPNAAPPAAPVAASPAPETAPEAAPAASPDPNAPAARRDAERGGRVQDLLLRANRLRGEGQYGAAERTYLRVVAQSPGGAAAYSALVAAAALRHERLSDARGALRLYEQALRAMPNGSLTPEIHEGMAQAYRKLGARAQERQALRALLAAKAAGPAAERARARLRELDAAR